MFQLGENSPAATRFDQEGLNELAKLKFFFEY